MAESNKTTRTMKRRGILAAASAVVTGIAAKQIAQPVAAAATMLFADTTAPVTNTASGPTVLIASDTGYTSTASVFTGQTIVSGAMCGIQGVTGLRGPAPFRCGVFGDCGTADSIGVFGNANSGFPSKGVFGRSESDGYGVVGQAVSGTGVQGLIPATNGAQPNTAANTIAVFGNNLSTGANGIGFYGSCANGTGIYGQTAASYQYGILGATYATNSTAIAGACTGNGSSAFSGGTTNPNAYAGVFQGNVVIQGRLVVSDPSYKSGALAHPDGSTRLVYCVESPEAWIEDVGTGHLIGGKGTVTFDTDFAAVTHTDTYHVFLKPEGDCNGLYVTDKSAVGFTVREVHNGTNALAFSWRVMVKGKSSVKSERLGKFTMPTIPLPDPSKFKAPDTPTPAVLQKKP